jgi:hypothetical protein
MTIKDGGYAFPQHGFDTVAERFTSQGGMTLRDHFAGLAMAAIIAKIPFQEFPPDWTPYEKTALGAYSYADAMLKAREAE